MRIKNRTTQCFIAFSLLILSSHFSHAQTLPKEIRGYKVHREKVNVTAAEPGTNTDAVVRTGKPKLVDVDLTGVTFELTPELHAMEQSGSVDFITFHNVCIDGIPVEIEEFKTSFSFRKKEPITLPAPARIFLPTHRMVQAAWKGMKDSNKTWTVSGRVFVFGKFRKFGFYFKRVIPIDIEFKIPNPLL